MCVSLQWKDKTDIRDAIVDKFYIIVLKYILIYRSPGVKSFEYFVFLMNV